MLNEALSCKYKQICYEFLGERVPCARSTGTQSLHCFERSHIVSLAMSLLTLSPICRGATHTRAAHTRPHTQIVESLVRLSIVLFSFSLSVSIICHSFVALLLLRTCFVVHFDCFVHFGHIYRWLVRVFDGSDNAKEGWVPASILEAQQMETAIYGDRVDDAAFRREYVFIFHFEVFRLRADFFTQSLVLTAH